MKSPFQIQFQMPDHPKGPDYWQPGRVFKTREAAEAALAKSQPLCPEMSAFRIIDRRGASRIVSEAKSRQTGTVVQVIDNRDGQDDGGDWLAICEHGSICGFDTKTAAMRFRPVPGEWCEECQQAEAVA